MARTSVEIVVDYIATMLATGSEITNYNIGSLMRSIADGEARELARLDAEKDEQIAKAVLNVAYQIWKITPIDAIASVYRLQFSNSTASDIVVAANTVISIPNSSLSWITDTEVTVPDGSTANVNATCTSTGIETNVPVNTITSMAVPVTGITVTNTSATPVTKGADAETETQTQARLANKIAELSRGTDGAIESGVIGNAKTYDDSGNVTDAVIKAKSETLSEGQDYVYCVNASNAFTGDLVTATQQVIDGYTDAAGIKHDGYKAAGVYATAMVAIINSLAVSLAVLPYSNIAFADITDQVRNTITNFFEEQDIGQSFSLANLYRKLTQVPGVADVVISSPSVSLPETPYITDPTVAPTLAAFTPYPVSGLVAGDYTVAYSFINPWGETLISPTSVVTITEGDYIRVSAITLPVGATGINYYLSDAEGSTTILYDATGTGASKDLTALPAVGADVPLIASTATIMGNLYTEGTVTITELTV